MAGGWQANPVPYSAFADAETAAAFREERHARMVIAGEYPSCGPEPDWHGAGGRCGGFTLWFVLVCTLARIRHELLGRFCGKRRGPEVRIELPCE